MNRRRTVTLDLGGSFLLDRNYDNFQSLSPRGVQYEERKRSVAGNEANAFHSVETLLATSLPAARKT